jgi:hypothetical protein
VPRFVDDAIRDAFRDFRRVEALEHKIKQYCPQRAPPLALTALRGHCIEYRVVQEGPQSARELIYKPQASLGAPSSLRPARHSKLRTDTLDPSAITGPSKTQFVIEQKRIDEPRYKKPSCPAINSACGRVGPQFYQEENF